MPFVAVVMPAVLVVPAVLADLSLGQMPFVAVVMPAVPAVPAVLVVPAALVVVLAAVVPAVVLAAVVPAVPAVLADLSLGRTASVAAAPFVQLVVLSLDQIFFPFSNSFTITDISLILPISLIVPFAINIHLSASKISASSCDVMIAIPFILQ